MILQRIKPIVILMAMVVVACGAQASAPDVIMTSSIGLNPNPVTVGSNLVVTYTVNDGGTAAAPLSHTKIQVKQGSSSTTLVQVTNNTPALAVGASTTDTVTIPIPAGAAPGGYTVYVILDFDNKIGQTTAGQANDIYQTTTSALTCTAKKLSRDHLED